MKSWNNFIKKFESVKGLGLIGFGDITGAAITSFFWLYLASMINPDEYGQIHFFLSMATIASSIALFGTQESMTVLTAKGLKIQSTLNLISLAISSIMSLFLILFFQRIDIGVLVFAFVINTLSIGDLLGKKKFQKYSQFIILQKILTLTLGIGFFYIFGVSGILFALAISYGGYLIRIIQIFRETPINFQLIKERSKFLYHNYVTYLLRSFGSQIDKILVVPLLGSTILGNYSLALQIITIFTMFTTILFKFLLSQESSGIKNETLIKIVIFVSIVISILGISLSPFVIPDFFPKYTDVSLSIQIMSLSIVPITITTILTSRLLSQEKSKLVLFGDLVALVILLVGIIILGPIYNTIGISMSYVLASICKSIYLVLIFKKQDRD